MKLEQAMKISSKINSAFRTDAGGTVIVDGAWTKKNPHCTEETWWVQQANRIVRDAYKTLDEVKQAVFADNHDDWQPYEEE